MENVAMEARKYAEGVWSKHTQGEGNLVAAAIGGSVARGVSHPGCDIDLLYFYEGLRWYNKTKATVDGWDLELHHIPCHFARELKHELGAYIVGNSCDDRSGSDAWGEKRCVCHDSTDDALEKLNGAMNAWRELHKVTTGIVLHDQNGWFESHSKGARGFEVDCQKLMLDLEQVKSSEDRLMAIVTYLKVRAFCRRQVFSKIYWVSEHIEYLPNKAQELARLLFSMVDFDPSQIDAVESLYNRCKSLFPRSRCRCVVCSGHIGRCHIGRVCSDYIHDVRRAVRNSNTFAAKCMFSRVVEYLHRLSILVESMDIQRDSESLRIAWSGRMVELQQELLGELKRDMLASDRRF